MKIEHFILGIDIFLFICLIIFQIWYFVKGIEFFPIYDYKKYDLPSIIPYNTPSSNNDTCDSCQFIHQLENPGFCQPSESQLKSIEKLTDEEKSICSTKICPETQNIVEDCYIKSNPVCSDCDFIRILDNQCLEISSSQIPDYNSASSLQKRVFSSINCPCTPTDSQINLYDKLVSKNSNLFECKENGCYPEMNDIIQSCTESKFPECNDCEFVLSMRTDCTDSSSVSDSIIKQQSKIGESCGCIPSISQLDLLKTLGDKHKQCSEDPYCTETLKYKDQCGFDLTQAPTIEPTLPPGLPDICQNCQFYDLIGTNSCMNSAITSAQNVYELKYYSGQCGTCTASDTQAQTIIGIKNQGKDVFECKNENCNELNTIASGC